MKKPPRYLYLLWVWVIFLLYRATRKWLVDEEFSLPEVKLLRERQEFKANSQGWEFVAKCEVRNNGEMLISLSPCCYERGRGLIDGKLLGHEVAHGVANIPWARAIGGRGLILCFDLLLVLGIWMCPAAQADICLGFSFITNIGGSAGEVLEDHAYGSYMEFGPYAFGLLYFMEAHSTWVEVKYMEVATQGKDAHEIWFGTESSESDREGGKWNSFYPRDSELRYLNAIFASDEALVIQIAKELGKAQFEGMSVVPYMD